VALLKVWGHIAMTAPLFNFSCPFVHGVPFGYISLVPFQGLKRARVFLFIGETVVGRPTGMFVVIKIGRCFSAGGQVNGRLQVRLWIVLVAILDPSVNFGSLVSEFVGQSCSSVDPCSFVADGLRGYT
jgi:hypothetical protein